MSCGAPISSKRGPRSTGYALSISSFQWRNSLSSTGLRRRLSSTAASITLHPPVSAGRFLFTLLHSYQELVAGGRNGSHDLTFGRGKDDPCEGRVLLADDEGHEPAKARRLIDTVLAGHLCEVRTRSELIGHGLGYGFVWDHDQAHAGVLAFEGPGAHRALGDHLPDHALPNPIPIGLGLDAQHLADELLDATASRFRGHIGLEACDLGCGFGVDEFGWETNSDPVRFGEGKPRGHELLDHKEHLTRIEPMPLEDDLFEVQRLARDPARGRALVGPSLLSTFDDLARRGIGNNLVGLDR